MTTLAYAMLVGAALSFGYALHLGLRIPLVIWAAAWLLVPRDVGGWALLIALAWWFCYVAGVAGKRLGKWALR